MRLSGALQQDALDRLRVEEQPLPARSDGILPPGFIAEPRGGTRKRLERPSRERIDWSSGRMRSS